MTEISEAARAKAGELLVRLTHHDNCTGSLDRPGECACGLVQDFSNVARFIQQVSDALKTTRGTGEGVANLAAFILPEAVDPLEDALAGCGLFIDCSDWSLNARLFRSTLAKRGLKIVAGDA